MSSLKLPPDFAEWRGFYRRYFIQDAPVHAFQNPNGKGYKSNLAGRLEDVDLELQFDGRRRYATYTCDEDGFSSFIVLDLDLHGAGEDPSSDAFPDRAFGLLRSIEAFLIAEGLPRGTTLREWTGGRGGHLWIFIDPATTAVRAQEVARALGHHVERELDLEGAELEAFPKNGVSFAPKEALPSILGLPGVHRTKGGGAALFEIEEWGRRRLVPYTEIHRFGRPERVHREDFLEILAWAKQVQPEVGPRRFERRYASIPMKQRREYRSLKGEVNHCAVLNRLVSIGKGEVEGKSLSSFERSVLEQEFADEPEGLRLLRDLNVSSRVELRGQKLLGFRCSDLQRAGLCAKSCGSIMAISGMKPKDLRFAKKLPLPADREQFQTLAEARDELVARGVSALTAPPRPPRITPGIRIHRAPLVIRGSEAKRRALFADGGGDLLFSDPCGLGKTRMALELLVDRAAEGLSVLYVTNTVNMLTESAQVVRRAIASSEGTLSSFVELKGVERHESCPQRDVIQKRMANGLDFEKKICGACPQHRNGCSYWAERERARDEATFVIAPVQLITTNPRFFERHHFDVVVFDENCYELLVERRAIERADVERFVAFADLVRDQGTAAKLKQAANVLTKAYTRTANMPAASFPRLTQADERSIDEALARGAPGKHHNLVRVIRNITRFGSPVLYRTRKDDDLVDLPELVYFHKTMLPSDFRLIILDATGDPELIRHYTGRTVTEVKSSRLVGSSTKVYWANDRGYSKWSLRKIPERGRSQLDKAVDDVILFLDDCRARGRVPALGMRKGGVRKTLKDGFILGELQGKCRRRFVVIDPKTTLKDLEGGVVPILTFGRERGINLLHERGVTDLFIVGTETPSDEDVEDRALALMEMAAYRDAQQTGGKRPMRGGGGLGARIEAQVQVAKPVQMAERIRTLIEDEASGVPFKRVFFNMRPNPSEWIRVTFSGKSDERNALCFGKGRKARNVKSRETTEEFSEVDEDRSTS